MRIDRYKPSHLSFLAKQRPRVVSVQVCVVLLLTLLLTSCGGSGVVFTDSHLMKLHESLVGREFVFRTDWYENFVVHQGTAKHKSLAFAGKNPSNYVKNAAQKYGDFEASAGTVARITDVRPESSYKLILFYTTEQGHRGAMPLMRFHFTEQNASIAWIEDQLTRETITFLVTEQDMQNQLQATAIKSLKEPELKPVTSGGNQPIASQEPAIERLTVRTDQQSVRHGQTIKLELDYTLDTAGQPELQVIESRQLSFNGKVLPGYPKEREVSVVNGRHSSSFSQKIPSRAAPGSYTYKGEVCLPAAACSSRIVRFTIER